MNLKGNKLSDKRFMKLVDQSRTTKQVLDYIRDHCPKTDAVQAAGKKGKNNKNMLLMGINILSASYDITCSFLMLCLGTVFRYAIH